MLLIHLYLYILRLKLLFQVTFLVFIIGAVGDLIFGLHVSSDFSFLDVFFAPFSRFSP